MAKTGREPQVLAARISGTVRDTSGREVLIAYAMVAPPRWRVFVELPADEANALEQ